MVMYNLDVPLAKNFWEMILKTYEKRMFEVRSQAQQFSSFFRVVHLCRLTSWRVNKKRKCDIFFALLFLQILQTSNDFRQLKSWDQAKYIDHVKLSAYGLTVLKVSVDFIHAS